MANEAEAVDLNEVFARFKHRYPFLFIDRILSIEPGRACRALKNLSVNEKLFQGHFPHFPVLPGVLYIEMMAQASVMVFASVHDARAQELGVLANVNNIKFLQMATPGDQLIIDVQLEGRFGTLAKFKGSITCADQVMARGSFTVALPGEPAD